MCGRKSEDPNTFFLHRQFDGHSLAPVTEPDKQTLGKSTPSDRKLSRLPDQEPPAKLRKTDKHSMEEMKHGYWKIHQSNGRPESKLKLVKGSPGHRHRKSTSKVIADEIDSESDCSDVPKQSQNGLRREKTGSKLPGVNGDKEKKSGGRVLNGEALAALSPVVPQQSRHSRHQPSPPVSLSGELLWLVVMMVVSVCLRMCVFLLNGYLLFF